jgi:hypothetical protein
MQQLLHAKLTLTISSLAMQTGQHAAQKMNI